MDYDAWLKQRLVDTSKFQTVKSDFLFECQFSLFMGNNCQLMRQFLDIKDYARRKLPLDSDMDDSSLYSEDLNSFYSSE